MVIAMHNVANADCPDQQQISLSLPDMGNVTVRAKACSKSETTGQISIEVSTDREPESTLQTDYESSAYVLALNTSIRFDDGQSQGLGVATGRGRDGTGMHYWKIPQRGKPIVDLGEAPALQRDRFVRGAFSTLVSSSGKYQSIRYFYEVKNDRLTPTSAVGFRMVNSRAYAARFIHLSSSGNSTHGRQKILSLERATACMNGRVSCW